MALTTSQYTADNKQRSISVRFQEIDPDGNGRPHEENLAEDTYYADSISDLPAPGDFLGLNAERLVEDKGADSIFEERRTTFKVLTRLFDFQLFDDKDVIICNIVVQEETNDEVRGRLIKT